MNDVVTPKSNSRLRHLIRPALLIVAVVGMLIAAKILGLDEKVVGLKVWIGELGVWGPLVFVALYTIAVVVAIPGSAITLFAGALFGSALGLVLVNIAATLGATIAFLIARYFAREAVTRWLSGSQKFTRLDDLTKKHGAIIVAITRLIPLFPFNLLNYGFGLTGVRLWTYVFWSWLCMIPGTVLFVVGADAVSTGFTEGKIPWGLVGIMALSLVVIIALVWRVRLYMKKKEIDTND